MWVGLGRGKVGRCVGKVGEVLVKRLCWLAWCSLSYGADGSPELYVISILGRYTTPSSVSYLES